MAVYFAFSDESGNYEHRSNRSDSFLSSDPYYLRATFIIEGVEWINLRDNFNELFESYEIEPNREIKWSYLYPFWLKREHNEEISENDEFHFLRHLSFEELIDLVRSCLSCLNQIESDVIITITNNQITSGNAKQTIYEWHLQETMQRIQMDYEYNREDLAVFFIDPFDSHSETNEFREVYRTIYEDDTFIDEFDSLKDGLNYDYSHHSVGIQLADFIAGCTNGFLREYQTSIDLFSNYVFPNLRTHQDLLMGRGIKEVPRNDEVRGNIYQALESNNLV